MPTTLPTRAALLACLTLACGPTSGETATAPTSATTDPGTSTGPSSTTVSEPGTSADPSAPMPDPTTGAATTTTGTTGTTGTSTTTGTTDPTTGTSTTTTTGEDTGPVGQCALEHDAGEEECDWFYTGYYFDPKSQTCQSFGYGDCGVPVVPFETLEACLVECEGCETDCSTSSGSSGG